MGYGARNGPIVQLFIPHCRFWMAMAHCAEWMKNWIHFDGLRVKNSTTVQSFKKWLSVLLTMKITLRESGAWIGWCIILNYYYYYIYFSVMKSVHLLAGMSWTCRGVGNQAVLIIIRDNWTMLWPRNSGQFNLWQTNLILKPNLPFTFPAKCPLSHGWWYSGELPPHHPFRCFVTAGGNMCCLFTSTTTTWSVKQRQKFVDISS